MDRKSYDDFRSIPMGEWVDLQFRYKAGAVVDMQIHEPSFYSIRLFPFNHECGLAILRTGISGVHRFVKYGTDSQWDKLRDIHVAMHQ